jgi:ABC-type multidrug transport system permease subunit
MTGFWRRLRAAIRARSLEFVRDRSALGWNLAFPILLVTGLAYMFSGPAQPQFSVAVLAAPDAALDARLHPFLDTQQIRFYRETDFGVAVNKVLRQRIDMLLDLRTPPGRYYVNEQSPKGYLVERLLRGSDGPRLERATTSAPAARYVDWVVPGILGVNMMFSCLYGLGYVIVRYRISGYLKRLNATPLRAVEFILAQLLSRLGLVMLTTVAVFAGTDLLLHFRVVGSYWNLLLVAVLGASSMIALGLVVAARIASEEFAGGILSLLSWPMMVICGVFFPLEGSPVPIRILSTLFPLTHMVDAARAVMLDGAGLIQIAPDLAALAAMSGIYLALGAAFFRWRQN